MGKRHPPTAHRSSLKVFLLDDDKKRHQWFNRRFDGDLIDIAEDVATAREYLENQSYDAIFLDHDLLPEHYKSREFDDERTGYAIALWLSENPQVQVGATIISHTMNADGALRMVELLRQARRQAEYIPFPMLEMRIRNYWR